MRVHRLWVFLFVFELMANSGARAREAGPRYSVELSASRSKEHLEILVTHLAGEDVFLVYERPYFRLLVGLWSDRAEAERSADKLRRRFSAAAVRNVDEGLALIRWQRADGKKQGKAVENLKDEAVSPLGAPDEGRLWRLLEESQYALLRQEIETLHDRHPGWVTPAALAELLERSETEQAIIRAEKSGDSEALSKLWRNRSRHFDCQDINRLWLLAEALWSTDRREEMEAVYRRILSECSEGSQLLATVQKASEKVSSSVFEEFLESVATRLQERPQSSPRVHQELAELRYQFHLARARDDHEALVAFRIEHRDAVEQRRDVDAALLVGWSALQTGELDASRQWFELARSFKPFHEEAARGLVLTHLGRGDLEAAIDVARPWAFRSTEIRNLITTALNHEGAVLFDEERYEESLTAFEESRRFCPLDHGQEMLRAWSFYHLDDLRQAARLFEKLYRQTLREDAAEGLLLSLAREPRWDDVRRLAEEIGGPLVDQQKQHQAARAFARKQFFLARHESPTLFPELGSIDSPGLGLGWGIRQKSGRAGLDRLRMEKAPAVEGFTTYSGVHRFDFRIDLVSLENGAFDAGTPIGSAPRQPTRLESMSSRVDDASEPRFSYRREAPFSIFAELGTTPRGGAVSPKIIFRLGVDWARESRDWGVEFYSQPVRESMLSYTGLENPYGPYSNERWGRVVRTGIAYQSRHLPARNLELAMRGTVARFTGQGVEDNWHGELYASLSRSVGHGEAYGLDRLSLGPWLFVSSYQKNLSEFTLGHGGYFSPQFHMSGGFMGRLLTREGRRFTLRAGTALGYQTYRKEASPYFPLAPDGRHYLAHQDASLVYAVDVQGAVLLHGRWQVGAAMRFQRTADWNERSGMVFLRFTLGTRRALFSNDLDERRLGSLF